MASVPPSWVRWIPPPWVDHDQRPQINARIRRINTQRQTRPRFPTAKIISRRPTERPHASGDPELIIELRRELGDVGQRRAIHSSDRNSTTETAGPEGAPRL